MWSFTRKMWQRSEVAALAAALLFGLALALLPATWKEWVGRTVVGTVFAPLEHPLYQLRSLVASRQENLTMRRRLIDVQLENTALRQAAGENRALREALALRARQLWLLTAAEVTSREPGLLAPDITIDKGRDQGLASGMVAIWQHGLVGLISGLDRATATVQTVFHPDSRVSAIDLRSRVLGIYRCLPGQGPMLDLVPLRSDIVPGDTLVSSGYGGVFPFGLQLGTVKRVEPDVRRLQLRVRVEPALDLNLLSQILIITGGQSPTLPSLAAPLPGDTATQKPRLRQPALMRPALKIRPPQPRVVTPDTLKLELEGDR